MKQLLVVAILLTLSSGIAADANLEKSLKTKCLTAFDVVRDNDAEGFIAMLPEEARDEAEISSIKKKVERRHKKYIVKGKGWSDLTFDAVTYGKMDYKVVEKFGAEEMARTFYNVVLKDQKKTRRNAHCAFAKVKNKWFLVKLP